MDEAKSGRRRRQPSVPLLGALVLAISQSTAGVARRRLMAALLFPLLVGLTMHGGQADSPQLRDRQDIVVAHPEWPTEILGAVASGVISAGMSMDMVRAAWGAPTHVSSGGSAWQQRETWHYTGRQHNVDMIGSQTRVIQPLAEWTVSFADGGVVGWTD